MSKALLDAFELEPVNTPLSAIRENYADTEGDTTGDGCGASPPAGPTSGCLIPGQL
ncbi:hypothetical protein [Streptomyces sp. NRRL S-350]|uniref:hypothetical protein n=1 Tax=Streptomyces sp. NRRL S-350 TaxID=1463902 RepID=UPI000AA1A66F|nr:hypothetical protein [Streptomyces sp. NRRL S-350]